MTLSLFLRDLEIMETSKLLKSTLKKIQYKLRVIRVKILKIAGNTPIFYKYQLINRLTTFKEDCTHIESFPTNEEKISKSWYLIIEPYKNIDRKKLPICLDEDDISIKKLEQYYHDNPGHYLEIPETFLSCIKEGKLICTDRRHGFYILSSDNYVYGDILFNNETFIKANIKLDPLKEIFCPPFQPKFKYYSGEYCLLTTAMTPYNYYHWMMDILPRLSLIQKFKKLETIPLIVQKQLTNFQKQSLQIAGISTERMLGLDEGYYQFEKLYYPSYLCYAGNSTKDTVDWYRTHFLKKFSLEKSSSPRYLYVSRQDVTTRRIINEAEIIEFLKDIGFEIIVTSKMSMEEQIKTFMNAKIIVAPHGAGLTNIVFAPQNTTVIEIFPETKNQIEGSYWNLANNCGHNYSILMGTIPEIKIVDRQTISTGWDDFQDRFRDFYVPLNKLKTLLTKVTENLF
jgi:hypothetical protein